ncbi:Acetoacetate metabolism regulatory protein AtoC [uncultured Desulfobacterium sp.]|uniref:Acetoacetate metabolism regulatory protein AtoC n=1 Tax=uncultured Desulfobacterium sp. TaxID=201089 RepID=A0A445MT94_9BACT|nr:Acetoacetate metabolism regulatory protein AtoC [uncultured Desulfobacterium sp.]
MYTESILIVDDEAEIRSAMSHALRRCGYSVESAASGLEALEKIKNEYFGLVITDVKMPEMSGIEVLSNIKKISDDIQVIIITGYGTIDNAVEAMREGASDYITKPFSFEILETAVKRVCSVLNNRRQCKELSYRTNRFSDYKKIITQDATLMKILDRAKNVAPTKSSILILGESGTGKELLANYIHQNSGRAGEPYIAVNCAALPENLAESELFGHEKGAFTGAANRKLGKLEIARQGTIVLDEIGTMSMPLQAKLLRALQEREIDRVGGNRPIPIDARIIAISNIDLKKAVKDGTFREDLFYRINVIPFTLPPLRERKSDIVLLAKHFVQKYASLRHRNVKDIADDTISILMGLEWKGNVREMENVIERSIILGSGEILLPEHLIIEEPDPLKREAISINAGTSVKDMERQLICRTLKEVNDNRTHAARLLGISIRTLRNKLSEYRLEQ